MLWRIAVVLAVAWALSRLLARRKARAGFSRAWHADQDRQEARCGYDGVAWRRDKLDPETWRPGRI